LTERSSRPVRSKILFLPLLFISVLALADQPSIPMNRGVHVDELLQARRGMEKQGFTSTTILEERLAASGYIARERGISISPARLSPASWTSFRREGERISDHAFRPTAYADIPDMQVNQENYASSFNQRNPAGCMFSDRSYITVWEDERNGDLDIFAQKHAFDGTAEGFNFDASEEDFPRDQYLPRVSALGDTSFVLVWVDEVDLAIYGMIFTRNLSPLTGVFQVSDSYLPYSTWAPAVSQGIKGEFVVVWEDTRSGSSIYGRRFDCAGNPLDSSFMISDEGAEWLRFSPDVSVDTSGDFVVAWEDFRNLDGDIYVQRFEYGGAKLGDNLLVNVDSLNEDQYAPSVCCGPNHRFMAAWLDYRREDPTVFARSVRFDDPGSDTVFFSVGTPSGTTVQERPQVVCDTLDRAAISWIEYTSSDRTVQLRRFNWLGQAVGDALLVSDLHSTAEIHSLALCGSPGGSLSAAWMDKRTGNYDIRARTLPSSGVPQTSILVLNDDVLGADQSRPRVAVRPDGGFLVAWEDMRRGTPDIFMRGFDHNAQPEEDDQAVNDTTSRVYRGNPDLACDREGNVAVVWEDARGDSLHIYAQLFDYSLNTSGANLRVDCAGTSGSSTPRCAMLAQSNFAVVWSSISGSSRHIFGRRFSSTGLPLDTCFTINDDSGSVNHLSPAVAGDSLGRFMVVWQDQREGHDGIWLQRFAGDGSRIGENFPVYSDRPDAVQYNPDVAMNQRGEFVVAWTEPYEYSTMIYAQRYDSSGTPLDTNIMVVDDPAMFPENPRVSLGDGGRLVVAWTDYGGDGSDIYYRSFSESKADGPSSRLNIAEDGMLQDFPHIALLDKQLYSVWRDNRFPGLGFSIFFDRMTLSGTDVEDDWEEENRPAEFLLAQNYPNPFNLTTLIRYRIRQEENGKSPIPVSLVVYNLLGQKVRDLVDGQQDPGEHQVIWDGRDDRGEECSSGVYFYRLTAGERSIAKKLVLLK
jgi:hypothetical protein